MGTLTDISLNTHDVGGPPITVTAPQMPGYPVLLPGVGGPYGRGRGDHHPCHYGGVGELVETLPDGFTYVSTTHGDVVRDGQELSFSLVGETSFTTPSPLPARRRTTPSVGPSRTSP